MSGPRSTCPALAATYSVTIRSNSSLTRLPSSLLGEAAPTVAPSSSISVCTASASAPSAPPTRMPMRSSVMPLLRRSCRGSRGAGQARGLGQVHGYQAAHARLAHGNPAQLLRRFHRRLVVGDEQELHLLAHLRDHRGEAAD